MRFSPKTDKEIQEERLLPEGTYPFEVVMAVTYTSKAGNEMMKVMMKVFKPDGKHIMITDYLMESMIYKLKHFFEATGLDHLYEAGEVKHDDLGVYTDLTGATGDLRLVIRKSEDYPDQNSVKDYVKRDTSAEVKKLVQQVNNPKTSPDDDMDDQIPF